MIDFNRPALVGKELNYIQDAVAQECSAVMANTQSCVLNG